MSKSFDFLLIGKVEIEVFFMISKQVRTERIQKQYINKTGTNDILVVAISNNFLFNQQ